LGRLQQSIFTTLLSQFFGSKKKKKENLEFEKKGLHFFLKMSLLLNVKKEN